MDRRSFLERFTALAAAASVWKPSTASTEPFPLPDTTRAGLPVQAYREYRPGRGLLAGDLDPRLVVHGTAEWVRIGGLAIRKPDVRISWHRERMVASSSHGDPDVVYHGRTHHEIRISGGEWEGYTDPIAHQADIKIKMIGRDVVIKGVGAVTEMGWFGCSGLVFIAGELREFPQRV